MVFSYGVVPANLTSKMVNVVKISAFVPSQQRRAMSGTTSYVAIWRYRPSRTDLSVLLTKIRIGQSYTATQLPNHLLTTRKTSGPLERSMSFDTVCKWLMLKIGATDCQYNPKYGNVYIFITPIMIIIFVGAIYWSFIQHVNVFE